MRPLFVILAFLAVLASGFWAYKENYATKQALKDANRLNREIAALRESIAVQRAEWAYLNRPDRLADLVSVNFDRLQLLPMQPSQFAPLRDLPAALPVLPEISDTITLQADTDEETLP